MNGNTQTSSVADCPQFHFQERIGFTVLAKVHSDSRQSIEFFMVMLNSFFFSDYVNGLVLCYGVKPCAGLFGVP